MQEQEPTGAGKDKGRFILGVLGLMLRAGVVTYVRIMVTLGFAAFAIRARVDGENQGVWFLVMLALSIFGLWRASEFLIRKLGLDTGLK